MDSLNLDQYAKDISYENHSTEPLGGNGPVLHRVSNVVFKNTYASEVAGVSKTLNISGDVFLLSSTFSTYFHTMRDNLLQLELIKKYIPTLKVVAVSDIPEYDSRGTALDTLWQHKPGSLMEYLKNTYFSSEELLLDFKDYAYIKFERIVFFYSQFTGAYNPFLPEVMFDSSDMELQFQLVEAGRASLSEKLSNILEETKIYVSRKKESSRLREIYQGVLNYKVGLPNDRLDQFDRDLVEHIADTPKKYEILEEQARSRCLLEGEEEILEEYFKSRGYLVVSPGDYSFIDQVKMFSSASVVVGFGGSGMTNTVFCTKDAKILILAPTDEFGDGQHYHLAKALEKDVYYAPKTYREKLRVFTAKEIIVEAEEVFSRYI